MNITGERICQLAVVRHGLSPLVFCVPWAGFHIVSQSENDTNWIFLLLLHLLQNGEVQLSHKLSGHVHEKCSSSELV